MLLAGIGFPLANLKIRGQVLKFRGQVQNGNSLQNLGAKIAYSFVSRLKQGLDPRSKSSF